MKPTAEDLEVARSIMEQFVDDEYLATKLGLEDAIASALATERAVEREKAWNDAINVARESVKKSIAASLNVSAAEIVIRRLEIASGKG